MACNQIKNSQMQNKNSLVLGSSLAITALIFMTIWQRLPVTDPQAYFNFAAPRLDVITNLPFLIIGLWGYSNIHKQGQQWPREIRILGIAISIGIFLTGFGSAYFHSSPSPETLFWDRLPMVLTFSSTICLLVADRVNLRLGIVSLPFVVVGSVLSLIGMKYGWFDLRPYIVVQYGGIFFLGLISIFRPTGRLNTRSLFLCFLLYALAKAGEVLDHAVFQINGIVSGHNLKHILAALAVFALLRSMNSFGKSYKRE